MVPARLVVLASGSGRRLESLLDACRDATYGASVVAIVSDGPRPLPPDEDGAGPQTLAVPAADHADPSVWEDALCEAVLPYGPDLVVCAGLESPLGAAVARCFPQRVLATHRSLLPAFAGPHPVRDALGYGAKVTGVTVYLLGPDRDEPGPVVAQTPVVVRSDDDERSLGGRIATAERALLVHAVGRLARSGYRVDGRKVILP